MQLKLLLFAISFFSAYASYSQHSGTIDVQHYTFAIILSDNSDTILGNAVIQVQFLQPTTRVIFDLASLDNKGKGMIVTSVSENNNRLKSFHSHDTLSVQLSKTTLPGEIKTFKIWYKGIPADGLIISKNKYGERTFFSDNWPNRAHHWLPCVDKPSDKASVEFIVTTPTHYQVVSNGIQIEETNLDKNQRLSHWKEEVPLPTKVMALGVADFAVTLSGIVDNIPVFSWVYPKDREKGFYDYAIAKDILPWFIKNIGDYPYKKLANVESRTIFGGLENAGAIFYAEKSVTGNRSTEALITHEIAHQWFGNMATEKSFGHIWLSEGFATYMTILYMESTYGEDSLQRMLKSDRQKIIAFSKKVKRPVVDTTTTNYMELLSPNSYGKGSWVLHMLRRQLGDSIFWKGIRKYYKTFAGSNADTHDLREIFEEISGEDLKTFFQQWLYVPGQPVLDASWKYLAKENKVAITISQPQNLFEFPLDIQIQTGPGDAINESIFITKRSETFTFPVNGKVTGIVLDPAVSLLFEGSVLQGK